MKQNEIKQLLQHHQFHIDPLGRLVIEDENVLKLIQGALGLSPLPDMMTDVACSNSACH